MVAEKFDKAWEELVRQLRADFGFGHIQYGVLVRPIGRDEPFDRSIGYTAYSDGFPKAVQKMYDKDETIQHEYAARHCIISKDTFHWYSDLYDEQLSPEEKRREALFAKHGLVVGMTLPLGVAAEPDICYGALGLAIAKQPKFHKNDTPEAIVAMAKDDCRAFRNRIRPSIEAIREIGREFHLHVFRKKLLGGVIRTSGGRIRLNQDHLKIIRMCMEGKTQKEISQHFRRFAGKKGFGKYMADTLQRGLFKVKGMEAVIANAVRMNIL